MVKPVAIRISSFDRHEVVYGCPKCSQSFAQFGDKELFCHHCGTKMDWNVTVNLKEEVPCDDDIERKFIDDINLRQLGHTVRK